MSVQQGSCLPMDVVGMLSGLGAVQGVGREAGGKEAAAYPPWPPAPSAAPSARTLCCS